jgi:hypothetical protein
VRTSLPDEREQQLVRRFFGDARSGFFVEVGANRPQEQSQTWHLEQLGWSGVLIEPRPTLPRSFRGCGARRSWPLPGRSAVSWNPGITRAGCRTAKPRQRVGWCKIRSRAFLARSLAARVTSTASAVAWMSCHSGPIPLLLGREIESAPDAGDLRFVQLPKAPSPAVARFLSVRVV